ncbi:MAG TPA: T9SS type A sorting domain-containing protein [Bacteroidales bacterium]|nr:T9SS type A sorting domain-containing protein [Bacteroidales bacterium]HSA44717.1 T9SS type A sorting domain-containing protein [Bacteroidales bacterium]
MKSKKLLLWITVAMTVLLYLPGISRAQQEVESAGAYWHSLRANQISGQIDPQDILNARTQAAMLTSAKSSTSLDLAWEVMGPDNYASRTRAILIDKNDHSIVFAASVTGGIWKSLSGGSSWSPTTVGGSTENIPNVTCLAQAPNGTIYAGTGESFGAGTGSGTGGIIGKGMFKSTDGSDFALIPSTQPAPNNVNGDWTYINKIAVTSEGRIYAATPKGLRYSDDEGNSWLPAKAGSTTLTGATMDVKVSPTGMVIANVGGAAYKSADGNPEGFALLAGGLPAASAVGRMEFALAPSNQDIIYVVAVKPTGALEGVYRSADRGENWQLIGPGGSPSFNVFNASTNITTGVGLYSCAIAVYPDNANQILVGGVNMWRGTKLDEGYYSWEQVSEGGITIDVFPLYLHYNHHNYVFHPTSPNSIYIGTDGGVSQSIDGAQTFQIRNKNYMVAQTYTVNATFKGEVLFGTQGDGAHLIDFTANTPKSSVQLARTTVGGQSAASFINPKACFIGTSNGTSYRSIDKGENLTAYYGSTMSNLQGSLVTPLTYWESFNDPYSIDSVMFVSYDTILPGQQFRAKSTNGDYPFWVTNSGPALYPKDTIYVTDPVQTKMFIGANGTVWYTKGALNFTGTPTWIRLANFMGIVRKMGITKDGNTLFAGLDNGLVIRINNIQSWVSDTANNLVVDTIFNKPNRVITSIAVNPSNKDHLLITLGNYGNNDYIYESVNATDTLPVFTNKQGNLPAMPVYASLIEMNHANIAIVGTELGIYSTSSLNNANPDWAYDSEGPGNLPVMELRQQSLSHWPIIEDGDSTIIYNLGTIYAASFGRGIFKCSNYNVVGIADPDKPESKTDMIGIYPNPAVNSATIEYSLNEPASVEASLISLTGKVVKEYRHVPGNRGKNTFQLQFDESLPSGTYFLRLTSPSGSRYGKLVIAR